MKIWFVSTNKDYRRQIVSLQEKLSALEKENPEFEADNEKIKDTTAIHEKHS